jgi:class 3 adenylate cyclase
VFVRADFPVGEKSDNSDTRRSLKLHRVIKRGAQAGCREALAGARLMSERIPELNASLQAELDRPLRIGVGIHCGPTIVGEMGYGNAAAITAIGDAVNTASRLESLTKNFACELVVSEETVSRRVSAARDRIRGKREMLAVRTLVRAAELPAAVLTTSNGRPRQASNGSLSRSIQANSNR